jgi:4-hydroxybenzoate polyprenyltransferase
MLRVLPINTILKPISRMFKQRQKILLMKIISLFSVVRGYNIPCYYISIYLSALFILAGERNSSNLLDLNLFLLVLASSCIASGYIINNFTIIKRPYQPTEQIYVRSLVKKKLSVYFTLNFIVAFIALIVSLSLFFFSSSIFLIWFYSLKR